MNLGVVLLQEFPFGKLRVVAAGTQQHQCLRDRVNSFCLLPATSTWICTETATAGAGIHLKSAKYIARQTPKTMLPRLKASQNHLGLVSVCLQQHSYPSATKMPS